MSLGIKTASGIQRVHSVRVKLPPSPANRQEYAVVQGGWFGSMGHTPSKYNADTECRIDCIIDFENYDASSITISCYGANIKMYGRRLNNGGYENGNTGWQALPYTLPSDFISSGETLAIMVRPFDDGEIVPAEVGKIIVADGATPPTLIAKSITANGIYSPISDNADGYNSVTVNVPVPPVQIEEFSLGTIIADRFIDSNTGNTSSISGESCTDFLEVDSDHYYAFSGDWAISSGLWDPACNATYNASKQYINGFNFRDYGYPAAGFILISFGNTVKYIRVSQASELFTNYKTKVYKIPKSAMPPRGT